MTRRETIVFEGTVEDRLYGIGISGDSLKDILEKIEEVVLKNLKTRNEIRIEISINGDE